jgi:hypothetical protein
VDEALIWLCDSLNKPKRKRNKNERLRSEDHLVQDVSHGPYGADLFDSSDDSAQKWLTAALSRPKSNRSSRKRHHGSISDVEVTAALSDGIGDISLQDQNGIVIPNGGGPHSDIHSATHEAETNTKPVRSDIFQKDFTKSVISSWIFGCESSPCEVETRTVSQRENSKEETKSSKKEKRNAEPTISRKQPSPSVMEDDTSPGYLGRLETT